MADEATELRARIERIPLLAGGEPKLIAKGFSEDRKYAVTKGDETFLLRVFELDRYPRKEMEFRALERMKQENVLCSRPLELGRWEEAQQGYMILTYIEGEEAAEAIQAFPDEIQYTIGLEAGAELLKIHRYEAPDTVGPWHERQTKKHGRNKEQYLNSGVRFRGDERLLAFVEEHLDAMKDRPTRFQHDDFHLANLVVKDGHLSGVIDFNRCDWGDPIHDFLKIGFFSADISDAFAVGQIHGYHQGREPDAGFWRLYSLYLAMNLAGSVAWTLKVHPDGLADMLARIDRVLEEHRDFETTVPAWYANYTRKESYRSDDNGS